MALLNVTSISKQLNASFALQDIGFEQEQFRNISITGETGSGKSTLLKIVAGLVQPDGGKVIFEGERIRGPEEQLIPGHPSIAYLSQDHELRNNYRVEELLSYANKLGDAEARDLQRICRIDHLLERKNNQLSGGEKQRIALARLLVGAPRLLLLDEPFSNLDMIHKHILKSVIEEIGKKLGVTCILTSHDPMDTLSWADEIIVMKNGQIVQKGSPDTIYLKPVNEYTAGLFGGYTLIDPSTAAALGWGTQYTDKKLLVRPEDLSLRHDGHGIPGRVERVMFWGGYYEADVLLPGTVVRMRTLENRLAVAQNITIVLKDGEKWWL